MAEHVEVVIKIPKYYLTHPQDYSCLAECVRRGTILKKGHGKIGDFDEFLKGFLFDKRADNLECGWIRELIEQVTIIEADKAESEE